MGCMVSGGWTSSLIWPQPLFRCQKLFKIPSPLLDELSFSNIFYLVDVKTQKMISNKIYHHISLKDLRLDTICWKNNAHAIYFNLKLGYNAWFEDRSSAQKVWWWKVLWGVYATLKFKFITWLDINTKFLTLDKITNQGCYGPNQWPLCKSHEESQSHVLLHSTMCLKSVQFYGKPLKPKSRWLGASLTDTFGTWWSMRSYLRFTFMEPKYWMTWRLYTFYLLMVFLHALWETRNTVPFSNVSCISSAEQLEWR